MLKVFATISCVFLLLTACGRADQYTGDGNFVPRVRRYSALAKSRGFMLELPVFRPTAKHTARYRLTGLPRMNREMAIALVTLIPAERIPPQDLDGQDFSLPPSHRIICTLIDTRTNQVIATKTAAVNDLPMTSVIALRNAPFVKEMLVVPSDAIPKSALLELELTYATGDSPLDRDMFVLVANEPPLL